MKKIVSKNEKATTQVSLKKVISDSHHNYTIVSGNKSLSDPRFKIKDYRVSDFNYNYLSFGRVTGKYYIESKVDLYKSILEGELHDHCLIDLKSDYYPLFYDLDMDLVTLSSIPNIRIFWDNLVKTIQEAILYYVDKVNVNYIYSDRSDKKANKLHIYFPGVIVDNVHAMCIRSKVLELLDNTSINYNKIVDASVYKSNGLRLMYQRKRGEKGYYKVNRKLSTWSDIPKSRLERMLLVSLKTDCTSINFNLSHNLPVIKKKVKKTKKKTIINQPTNSPTNSPTNINLAYITELFNNLSPSRLDSYDSWIKCLMLCRNHGLVNLAHSISSRSSKYDAAEVDKIMSKQRRISNPLTIRSLESWSRADNISNHVKIVDKYHPHTNINEFDYVKKDFLVSIYSDEYLEDLYENIDFDKFKYSDYVILCSNYGWIRKSLDNRPDDWTKHDVLVLLSDIRENSSSMHDTSMIYWSRESNKRYHNKIVKSYKGDPYKYREVVELPHGEYRELFSVHEYNFGKFCNYVELDVNYLSDLDTEKYNTFFIKSPTGTAKSSVAIKAVCDIEERGLVDGINCVVSRRCLVRDLVGRFSECLHGETVNRPKKLCMESYMDIKKSDLCNTRRLIRTPDSLVHMCDDDGNVIYPDCAMVDEIASHMSYCTTSSTIARNRRLIWEESCEIFRRAKVLIVLDSNLTEEIVELITSLRDKETSQVIFNRRKTDKQNYYIMKSEYKWMSGIYDKLGDGKRLFICTDSKTKSNQIYIDLCKKYPLLKIRLYNSDTGSVEMSELEDVNKHWIGFDVVICSPTITFGINFDVINHFDTIYSYCQGTILPQSLFQQIRRVRHPTELSVFICLMTYVDYADSYPTEISKLKRCVKDLRNDVIYKESMDCVSTCIEENKRVFDDEDMFTNMFLHNVSIKNRSRNNYEKELVYYLTEYGGRVFVSIGEVEKSEIYDERVEEIKLEINKKLIKDLVRESKNEFNLNDIKYKTMKSVLDKVRILSSHIMSSFGLNELNADFLTRLGHTSNIDAFNSSLVYSMKKNERSQYLRELAHGEMGIQFDMRVKQVLLLQELSKLLYGSDGIYCRDVVIVKTGVNSLRRKHKKFLESNFRSIQKVFSELNIKRSPKTLHYLYLLHKKLVEYYFGGFVVVGVSKRKSVKVKRKLIYHYNTQIDCSDYIELMLNKNNKRIKTNKIKHIYGNNICRFNTLHNSTTFNELINKKEIFLFEVA